MHPAPGPLFQQWSWRPGTAIAITGATGWLGQAMAAEASRAGYSAAVGNLRLFGSRARTIEVEGVPHPVEALDLAAPLDGRDWLFAHLAFLGKERSEDLDATAFRAANDAILHEVRRITHDAASLRLLFSSSGAVYAHDRTLVRGPDADLYGMLKVEHEARLHDWCGDAGVALTVARIFNIGGPFMNKLDRYMLSSVIGGLRHGGRVRIAARRPVFRSFVDVGEACAVMLEAAVCGEPGRPTVFDTAGREIVEVEELARTAAAILGVNATIERQWDRQAASDWYVGDAAGYLPRVTALGRPVATLADIIRRTDGWLHGLSGQCAR